jgi:hypothetical protein
VVSLVLCHHPPTWLSDAGEARNNFDGRAKLQFFGHEHEQRCERLPEYMRFHAGAVNPERDAAAWKPGYNLVDMNVVEGNGIRQLKISAQIRQFQPAPNEVFHPYFTNIREDVWTHSINVLRRRRASPPVIDFPESLPQPPQAETRMSAAIHAAVEGMPDPKSEIRLRAGQSSENNMSEPSTDDLAYRFWQLATHQRLEIALAMGLITEKDLEMAPPQRYTKALTVATEKGLLTELARQIQENEKKA